MKENELPSCPFCGGHAELKKDRVCAGHGETEVRVFVQCTECGARSGSDVGRDTAEIARAELNVTAKWNQRHGTVRHGKWEYENDWWACSECGHGYDAYYLRDMTPPGSYCPYCGAKMIIEEEKTSVEKYINRPKKLSHIPPYNPQ